VEGTASEALASGSRVEGWRIHWRGRRGAGEGMADPLEGIGGSCEARGVARGERELGLHLFPN
jgi:hypothetical protein